MLLYSLVWKKTRMVWLHDNEKTSCLHTIAACDGRTDILPRHSPRYAYASRGKNYSHTFNLLRPYDGVALMESNLVMMTVRVMRTSATESRSRPYTVTNVPPLNVRT